MMTVLHWQNGHLFMVSPEVIKLYRNFHFIYADQEIVGIKIPLNKLTVGQFFAGQV